MNYSVTDVARILGLSRSTLRGLITAGFVTPSRGRRQELRFSFQDLIVLRTARGLIAAKIPRRRINRSLEDLRRTLPESVPLSGLSICAVGDRVVVRDGFAHWQADDGQYVLGLDVGLRNGELKVIERTAAQSTGDVAHAAVDPFEQALELEDSDARAAIELYKQATQADACNVAAWINWGRLLQEQGETKAAEAVYRQGYLECGPDALLMFNLGVLLEDTGRAESAIDAYQEAVQQDPTLADGHFNLARLYESLGKAQHAIRHFGQYRRLLLNQQH